MSPTTSTIKMPNGVSMHDESVKEIACTFNEMDEAFAENYN